MPMSTDELTADTARIGTLVLGSGSFGDETANAADPLADDKTYKRIAVTYQTDRGTAVSAKRRLVHIAKSDGTIIDCKARLGVPCGGTTSYVKVHVKKNGTNVTNTQAEVNPTHAAYTGGANATFLSTSYLAGDTLEFDVSVSAGDGAVGEELLVQMNLTEKP